MKVENIIELFEDALFQKIEIWGNGASIASYKGNADDTPEQYKKREVKSIESYADAPGIIYINLL